jgi:hypothetical protein
MGESWDATTVKLLGISLPVLFSGVSAGVAAWMFEDMVIYGIRKYRWVLPVGAALSATALTSWMMYKVGGIGGLLQSNK